MPRGFCRFCGAPASPDRVSLLLSRVTEDASGQRRRLRPAQPVREYLCARHARMLLQRNKLYRRGSEAWEAAATQPTSKPRPPDDEARSGPGRSRTPMRTKRARVTPPSNIKLRHRKQMEKEQPAVKRSRLEGSAPKRPAATSPSERDPRIPRMTVWTAPVPDPLYKQFGTKTPSHRYRWFPLD